MASTAHLNPSQFEQAALGAIDLDKIVARVGTACIAVERRADNLGAAVDLSCSPSTSLAGAVGHLLSYRHRQRDPRVIDASLQLSDT